MKIVVNSTGEIEYTSIPLKKGLNVFGKIKGVVDLNSFKVTSVSRLENLNPGKIPLQVYGEGIFIFSDENYRFSWASSDLSGIRDIFYAKLPNGKMVISDNFFEAFSGFPLLTMKLDNLDFFIRHGYLLPGLTFFEEIHRLKVGNRLNLDNGDFSEDDILGKYESKIEISYELFKSAFDSVFQCERVSDDDVVLLSGGCDSGLIATLSAIKFSKHPLALTLDGSKNPYRPIRKDTLLSKRLARFLGLDHLIVDLDLEKESATILNSFTAKMPLAAHFSLGFFKMVEAAKVHGKRRFWCGQNADSVCMLGPTGDGLGHFFKRFYLSDGYIRSLSDIKNKSVASGLYWLFGQVGLKGFEAKRKLSLKQARNFQEFLTAYEESEEYLSLLSKNKSYQISELPIKIYSLEAKRKIFDRKIQSFLIGRDPRVVYSAADIFGFDAILPYSATNMLHFFRNFKIGFFDVLKPKRFIYRYLKEILGEKNYDNIYSLSKKEYEREYNSKEELTDEEYYKKVAKSNFGKELCTAVKKIDFPKSILSKFGNIEERYNNNQYLLSFYWINSTLQKARNEGTEVVFSN